MYSNKLSLSSFLLFCTCVLNTTVGFTQSNKKPSSFHPAYIGTFSSVSVITNDSTVFSDTLTEIAAHVYDSVITSRVRYLDPVNTIEKIPEAQLRTLTKAITKNVLQYKRKDNLKKVIPTPILDSIASLYDNRYSSYFITFGKISSKKENRKHLTERTVLITAAIVGFAVLAVLSAYSGGSMHLGDGEPADDDDFLHDPFFGMYCYYLVYDKQEKQMCYIRGMRFNSDKTDNAPFNPARVEKQIESLFYLPH